MGSPAAYGGEDVTPDDGKSLDMTATTDHRSQGVRFTFEEDLVTAIDVGTGVAATGSSKADALSELADALRLHEHDERQIQTDEDERAVLNDLGIDPGDVEPIADLPEFLQ